MNNNNLIFFLGGYDLEMVTIRDLLSENNIQFYDKKLSWGAKASSYNDEINETLKKGYKPVLIELIDDLNIQDKVLIVDHHGKFAGKDKPTAIEQVFNLIGLPQSEWTRFFELVAANDMGYIPALVRVGANKDEIIEIRTKDRNAQGITDEQEKLAQETLKNIQKIANNSLTLVNLPHNKTSAVSDRLQPELGGEGFENLLVICPDELNFFGKGNLVVALNKKYSGWYGGALPDYGFWGHGKPKPDVLEFLISEIEK